MEADNDVRLVVEHFGEGELRVARPQVQCLRKDIPNFIRVWQVAILQAETIKQPELHKIVLAIKFID